MKSPVPGLDPREDEDALVAEGDGGPGGPSGALRLDFGARPLGCPPKGLKEPERASWAILGPSGTGFWPAEVGRWHPRIPTEGLWAGSGSCGDWPVCSPGCGRWPWRWHSTAASTTPAACARSAGSTSRTRPRSTGLRGSCGRRGTPGGVYGGAVVLAHLAVWLGRTLAGRRHGETQQKRPEPEIRSSPPPWASEGRKGPSRRF